ncbi:MAG: aspartate aminotransferase family protein [Bacteroidetes bacterium]|nr:MAG: aspartate aminotransferase family protein [Bacteroidota bacterium]
MKNLTPKEIFFQHQAQTSLNPLAIEVAKAEGIFVWDAGGKKYMDLTSGIAVTNIGHRHPAVEKAIQKQLEKYWHVMPYGEFIQSPQTDLAMELKSILPPPLSVSYFVNSGTEANEAAVKLAKRFTGRFEIAAFKKSYHGNTQGSLSITGNENKKQAFRPLIPGITFLEFNNISDLELITEQTAGVIIEPVQGDAGVVIPSVEFMQALRKRCNETGTLLIFDEIQTAFGRTGKMFAFEHFDVLPDIITLAKALGGGMPIGAFVSSKEIMQTLSHNPALGHITTFGGHPISCAAAAENIRVLKTMNMQEVSQKGTLFKELLQHEKVKEIRQIGLMIAVELTSADEVQKIVKHCLNEGLITFWFLSNPKSFRLQPPLIISKEEIRYACQIIRKGFDLL